MRKREFYILTLVLLIAAIIADFAAKQFAAGGATTMARAAATTPAGDETAHAEAYQLAEAHDWIAVGSLGLLMAGVASWICSLRRAEPALQSVPLVALFVAILMQLVMV